MGDRGLAGGNGRTWAPLVAAGLLLAGLLSAAGAHGPGESCVTCHTDAAKLKALTPPDPPVAEAGEG